MKGVIELQSGQDNDSLGKDSKVKWVHMKVVK